MASQRIKMNENKGFIGIGLIIAIVLGIVVVGGGAYYLGKGSNKLEVKNPENILLNNENQNSQTADENQKLPTNNQIDNSPTKTISTSNWKTYTNTKYGFELKYPSDWEFSTYFSFADGFFFSKNKSEGGLKFIILPKGEFDHGYSGEPFISDIQIGGKQAKKSKWNDYVSYQFTDSTIPSTWIRCGLDLKSCNRIEIQGSDQLGQELIDQIISTFKFIN